MNAAYLRLQTVTLAVLIAAFTAPDASALLPSDQQRCITSLNARMLRVVSATQRQIRSCMRGFDAGEVSDIRACTESDLNGTIGRARERTLRTEDSRCAGTALPVVFFAGANALNSAGESLGLSVLEDLFGVGETGAVPSHVDASTARCQTLAYRALAKCERAKLAEFNRCKKTALKNGAQSPGDLDACVLADPKGRIARACRANASNPDPLRRALQKQCLDRGVDLNSAFPHCGSGDLESVHTCLESPSNCALCESVRDADGLAADCDLLDNQLADASCGTPPSTCGNAQIDPGEVCDGTLGSSECPVEDNPLILQCRQPGDIDECQCCTDSFGCDIYGCCDRTDLCTQVPGSWVCTPCIPSGFQCGSTFGVESTCCGGNTCFIEDVTEFEIIGTCFPDHCGSDADCLGGQHCESGNCCAAPGQTCSFLSGNFPTWECCGASICGKLGDPVGDIDTAVCCLPPGESCSADDDCCTGGCSSGGVCN